MEIVLIRLRLIPCIVLMKVALVEVRLYESSPCCGNIYVSGLTTPPLTSPHLSSQPSMTGGECCEV